MLFADRGPRGGQGADSPSLRTAPVSKLHKPGSSRGAAQAWLHATSKEADVMAAHG